MKDRTGQDFDVVIVGGGLVGMSLALALDRVDGLRVLAIEAQAPPTPQAPRWDERHFALGRASTLALDALGVAYAAAGQHPIRRIHVSRRGAFGRTLLDAAAQGLPAFGQIVPARQLAGALDDALARTTRLERGRPARLQDFTAHDDHVALNLRVGDDERHLRTRLLVAADGTDSVIRNRLNMPLQRHDYDQTAIVTAIEVERDLDGCAYERFTDSGPIALLPLDRRRAGLVMTLTTEQAIAALAMSDDDFLAFAEHRFGTRLGHWRKVGQRQPWPLKLQFAERVVDRRVAVIGNAAQTIHPIGAQGFNLGLRDALALADVVAAHREDIGSVQALADYAERRRDDREHTARFSDALARFMASDLPLGPLRSLALMSAEHLPIVRDALVNSAMGFR